MQPKCEKQVITLRNRLDVLLFVFVVKHFLCCCDVEINPGPTKENLQDDTPDGPNGVHSDSDTLTPGIPLCNLQGIQAYHLMWQHIFWKRYGSRFEKLQSLETNLSLMRNDLGAIKTDIGLVRTRCQEIDKRCDRLEKENEKLSSSMQDAERDV